MMISLKKTKKFLFIMFSSYLVLLCFFAILKHLSYLLMMSGIVQQGD